MVVKLKGNPEGYLLLLDKKSNEGKIVYCTLCDGLLNYYLDKNGPLLGTIYLTTHKLKIQLIPEEIDEPSYRFIIYSIDKLMNPSPINNNMNHLNDHPISSYKKHPMLWNFFKKNINEQEQIKDNHPILHTNESYIFIASKEEIQLYWSTALLNWHRHTWDETYLVGNTIEDYNELMNNFNKYHIKEKQYNLKISTKK